MHILNCLNQETYGEDPFLSGVLVHGYVRGLQGDHPRYVRANAGCKHFDVHGGPENIPVERYGFDAKVRSNIGDCFCVMIVYLWCSPDCGQTVSSVKGFCVSGMLKGDLNPQPFGWPADALPLDHRVKLAIVWRIWDMEDRQTSFSRELLETLNPIPSMVQWYLFSRGSRYTYIHTLIPYRR